MKRIALGELAEQWVERRKPTAATRAIPQPSVKYIPNPSENMLMRASVGDKPAAQALYPCSYQTHWHRAHGGVDCNAGHPGGLLRCTRRLGHKLRHHSQPYSSGMCLGEWD